MGYFIGQAALEHTICAMPICDKSNLADSLVDVFQKLKDHWDKGTNIDIQNKAFDIAHDVMSAAFPWRFHYFEATKSDFYSRLEDLSDAVIQLNLLKLQELLAAI